VRFTVRQQNRFAEGENPDIPHQRSGGAPSQTVKASLLTANAKFLARIAMT